MVPPSPFAWTANETGADPGRGHQIERRRFTCPRCGAEHVVTERAMHDLIGHAQRQGQAVVWLT